MRSIAGVLVSLGCMLMMKPEIEQVGLNPNHYSKQKLVQKVSPSNIFCF
jgi:hypothetical protein